MSIDLADYQAKAAEAVRTFWQSREVAGQKQTESGRSDRGERSKVTSGKHMDGFLALVGDIVHLNGLVDAHICLKRRVLTLPGYFRPTKQWDLLVMNGRHLVAAIEFKSQVGPSFGNNYNNRAEEAIGSAVDLWTAFRRGAFGQSPPPFLGWLILVEDCKTSRSAVRNATPHFPVLAEFNQASYADRYNLLCQKLVYEKLYASAAVLLSPRSAANTGDFSTLSEMTSVDTFVSTLAGYVAAASARSS